MAIRPFGHLFEEHILPAVNTLNIDKHPLFVMFVQPVRKAEGQSKKYCNIFQLQDGLYILMHLLLSGAILWGSLDKLRECDVAITKGQRNPNV